MTPLLRRWRRVRRRVLLHRRPFAALLVAVAVLAGLRATAAPVPPRNVVVVAVHDLPAGTVLRAGDVATRAVDPAGVSSRTLVRTTAATGRTTAGPVRAGEPLTDVRLVGPSLASGYPGRVAVPVRLADASAVSLLQVGDLVALSAADPQGETSAYVVAHDAAVVALPRPAEGQVGAADGALVLLAVPADRATAVASANVRSYLSFMLEG